MKRNLMGTVGVTTLILASINVAYADKVDYVTLTKDGGIHIHDGRIVVKPVNGEYSQLASPTVSYHMRLGAGCKGLNKLKSAFVSAGVETVSGGVLEYSDNYRVDVPTTPTKTMSNREAVLNIPVNKLMHDPVAACKNMMEYKMSKGATKQQILAQNQVINYSQGITGVVSCGGNNSNKHEFSKSSIGSNLQIVCQAGSVPGVGGIQMQPSSPPVGPASVQTITQVTAATFQPSPKNSTISCPGHVKFTGKISASGPGEVKYRVLFPGVNPSPAYSLQFDKAGSKNIDDIWFVTHNSLPVASAALEVISPNYKKTYAGFSVKCIAAEGPGSVQIAPQPNNQGKPGKLAPQQTTPVEQGVLAPPPTMQLKKAVPRTEPGSSPQRVPSRSTE